VIPKNRPVVGQDFANVARDLDIKTPDMIYLVGSMPQPYYTLTQRTEMPHASTPGQQRPSITQAILLRLISEDPSLLPLPRSPDIKVLFELCQSIDSSFTRRHLAVLLGRDGTAGYKWLAQEGRSPMRQEVERLKLIIWNKLTSTPVAQRNRALQMMMDVVALEAQLRGFDHAMLRTRFRFKAAKPPAGPKPAATAATAATKKRRTPSEAKKTP